MPRDIAKPLLLGFVISGAIAALVPEGFFADRMSSEFLSMLLMMVVGLPLYVCSTGSIPLAVGLIHMGISPGAAFVFLVTGPATNVATLTSLWSRIGRRSMLVYLAVIAVLALVTGAVVNQFFAAGIMEFMATHNPMEHSMQGPKAIFAVILLILMAPGLIPKRKKA